MLLSFLQKERIGLYCVQYLQDSRDNLINRIIVNSKIDTTNE